MKSLARSREGKHVILRSSHIAEEVQSGVARAPKDIRDNSNNEPAVVVRSQVARRTISVKRLAVWETSKLRCPSSEPVPNREESDWGNSVKFGMYDSYVSGISNPACIASSLNIFTVSREKSERFFPSSDSFLRMSFVAVIM